MSNHLFNMNYFLKMFVLHLITDKILCNGSGAKIFERITVCGRERSRPANKVGLTRFNYIQVAYIASMFNC